MQTMQLNQPSENLLDEIKLLVGSNGWKSADEMPRYFDDPRGRFEGFGAIIVLPNSTEQVSLIVKLCNAKKVGLVPYSGGTGVVAGQLSIDYTLNLLPTPAGSPKTPWHALIVLVR